VRLSIERTRMMIEHVELMWEDGTLATQLRLDRARCGMLIGLVVEETGMMERDARPRDIKDHLLKNSRSILQETTSGQTKELKSTFGNESPTSGETNLTQNAIGTMTLSNSRSRSLKRVEEVGS
jgi:hypothetical protein